MPEILTRDYKLEQARGFWCRKLNSIDKILPDSLTHEFSAMVKKTDQIYLTYLGFSWIIRQNADQGDEDENQLHCVSTEEI